MRDYFEELRERRSLCYSKQWLAYYLYLLKYHHTTNGTFDIYKFRESVLKFPQIPPAIHISILGINDFIAIERLFFKLAENVFKANFCFHRDNLDHDRQIESSATSKAIYIATKIEEIVEARYGWRENVPLSEVCEKIQESLTGDMKIVEEIQPIPENIKLGITSQILQVESFEELETELEKAASKLWDCVEYNTDGISNDLEKAGLEAPKYDGNLRKYCAEIDGAMKYLRRREQKHTPEPDVDVSDFFDR